MYCAVTTTLVLEPRHCRHHPCRQSPPVGGDQRVTAATPRWWFGLVVVYPPPSSSNHYDDGSHHCRSATIPPSPPITTDLVAINENNTTTADHHRSGGDLGVVVAVRQSINIITIAADHHQFGGVVVDWNRADAASTVCGVAGYRCRHLDLSGRHHHRAGGCGLWPSSNLPPPPPLGSAVRQPTAVGLAAAANATDRRPSTTPTITCDYRHYHRCPKTAVMAVVVYQLPPWWFLWPTINRLPPPLGAAVRQPAVAGLLPNDAAHTTTSRRGSREHRHPPPRLRFQQPTPPPQTVVWPAFVVWLRSPGDWPGDPVGQLPPFHRQSSVLTGVTLKCLITLDVFSRPIIQGQCTLGLVIRAIIKKICNGDASLVKAISGRFLLHVYPGETLNTEMWLEGLRVLYQTKVKDRNRVVLSGFVDLNSTRSSSL
ncbi:hypothetical protein OSB04_028532 [Centaurea solstitialis]|uniref:MaoC-like domain-containing protein n=1 Tax=Centaurea solstitialis TaxID=347529 RepID=A0AA38SU79_9ASTR|nr:hypothetical protein OSB04_028532 [Centaurea solstitialis]